MIRLRCPACGRSAEGPDSLASSREKCYRCNVLLEVDASPPTGVPLEAASRPDKPQPLSLPRSFRWAAIGLLLGANVGAIAFETIRAEPLVPVSGLFLPHVLGAGGVLGGIAAVAFGLFASFMDLDTAGDHFAASETDLPFRTADFISLPFPFDLQALLLPLTILRMVLGVAGPIGFYAGLFLLGMVSGEVSLLIIRGQVTWCLWMIGNTTLGAILGAAIGWTVGRDDSDPTEDRTSAERYP